MIDEKEEFNSIIKDVLSNDMVQKMKLFRQHCDISCFDHCYRTAFLCYKICKKLNWDYVAVARAAMVHDLFLYDWREKSDRKGLHAFTHPITAYQNASKMFELSDKEKDIIVKHMWPLTWHLPKYKESYVLTFMDKYSAIKESFDYSVACLKNSVYFKYAYVVLAFCLFSLSRRSKLVVAAIIRDIMLLFMV